MVGQLTAGDEVNVLVTGPTGAGKTWLVRLLARQAWGAEWLEEVDLRDCDASSLASRLAGTRRGDFTGAVDRQGAVARAISRGVPMLLDELQALDHSAQGTLLSLLDLPRRLAGLSGTSQRLPGQLHVFGTTNHPVAHRAWEHHFRPDFWYRLVRGVHLDLPPLAARGPDVVHAWLTTFLDEACGRRPGDVLDAEALGEVLAAPWPGNLRELRGFAGALAALRRPQASENRLILSDICHLFEPPPLRVGSTLTRRGGTQIRYCGAR